MVNTLSTGIRKRERRFQISKLFMKMTRVPFIMLNIRLRMEQLLMAKTTLKLQQRVLKQCLVMLRLRFILVMNGMLELLAKKVLVPLVNREVEIITDQYVTPDFGTGMVKITPAHDPNDFQVGNRHDLPRINTMNEDASMNENAGKYQGMDRFEARDAMVKDLDAGGYLLSTDPIVHSVGHSERTGVQVEARLSTSGSSRWSL